jgi:hypothetical protein
MSDRDPLVRTLAVAAVAILLAIAVTYLFTRFYVGPRLDRQAQLAFLLSAKLFVSTFNVVVLVAIYRDIPNQFTLSLLLFCLALLLYALTSNPLVHVYLGFRGGVQLGLFTFLPDLFAGVAVVALLYQSYT